MTCWVPSTAPTVSLSISCATSGPVCLPARGMWPSGAARGARCAAISATRVLFGLSTMSTLLLYRNYFHDEGLLRAASSGWVKSLPRPPSVICSPPWSPRRSRVGSARRNGSSPLYAGAAASQLACGLPFRLAPLLVGAALLGAATAGAKICVDTIVQEQVDDDFRGRVFSFYDTLFNVTFVVAAVAAAFMLPRTGRSTTLIVVLAVGYAVTAAAFGLAEVRAGRTVKEPVSVSGPAAARA